jgi:DNA invertase Pin-like site-specific DNA recombinase
MQSQSKVTALYSHLSRDDEQLGDSASIKHQKEMLEEYAAKNGFANIRHFSDDGYTGGNLVRVSLRTFPKHPQI